MQIASLFVVNLQTKVSWTLGYAVPTAAFGIALSLFLLGTRLYSFVPPGGSALTRIGQVLLPSPPGFYALPDSRNTIYIWRAA